MGGTPVERGGRDDRDTHETGHTPSVRLPWWGGPSRAVEGASVANLEGVAEEGSADCLVGGRGGGRWNGQKPPSQEKATRKMVLCHRGRPTRARSAWAVDEAAATGPTSACRRVALKCRQRSRRVGRLSDGSAAPFRALSTPTTPCQGEPPVSAACVRPPIGMLLERLPSHSSAPLGASVEWSSSPEGSATFLQFNFIAFRVPI